MGRENGFPATREPASSILIVCSMLVKACLLAQYGPEKGILHKSGENESNEQRTNQHTGIKPRIEEITTTEGDLTRAKRHIKVSSEEDKDTAYTERLRRGKKSFSSVVFTT